MTVIVGLVKDGVVHMGADSRCAKDTGWHMVLAEPKLFRRGSFVVGSTWMPRFGQVICHAEGVESDFAGVDRKDERDVYGCMYRFVDSIREAYKKAGSLGADDGLAKGNTFIVAFAGRLFEVDSMFSFTEHRHRRWMAVGSGRDEAHGALRSLESLGHLDHWEPRRSLEFSLEVACALNSFCAPPFDYLTLGP